MLARCSRSAEEAHASSRTCQSRVDDGFLPRRFVSRSHDLIIRIYAFVGGTELREFDERLSTPSSFSSRTSQLLSFASPLPSPSIYFNASQTRLPAQSDPIRSFSRPRRPTMPQRRVQRALSLALSSLFLSVVAAGSQTHFAPSECIESATGQEINHLLKSGGEGTAIVLCPYAQVLVRLLFPRPSDCRRDSS